LVKGSVYKRCQCRDVLGRRVGDCGLPHGSWGFTVDVARDHRSGGRRQVARSGFGSRQAAEVALADALSLLAAGVWVDDRDLTLGSWLQTWLRLLAAAGRSPKTLANYRGHVRDVWDPCLGRIRLRDLRRIDLEQVLADLLMPNQGDAANNRRRSSVLVRSPVPPGSVGRGNVGRRVDRRAVETVEGYRRTIRAALAMAQRRGLIAVNPALGRMDALPVASSVAAANLVAWEPVQLACFLEHVTRSGERLAALYEVAAYTGMRRGELCGLHWSDLDPDQVLSVGLADDV